MRISDDKVIADFAAFMSERRRADCFYDVNALPHPKGTILAAIERTIAVEPLAARVDWLRTGAMLLWNFQPGVGPDPLPLTGVDLENLPRGVAPADMEALRRALDDSKQNAAQAARLREIAGRETIEIKERIEAAVSKRVLS